MFLSEPGTTAFEALKDLLLEIAQERELGTLLPLIVRRVAESSDSIALARIWLLGPGDSCATCRNAPVCPSHEQCLHLAASAVRPLHGSVSVDSQLLGAFRRIPIGAFKVGAVVAERRAVIVTALALTYLNPGVYLDTVILLGTVANSHRGEEWAFGAGAALGSIIWFVGIGYGARLLSPFFAKPQAWRILDVAVAVIMVTIAVRLALS